MAGRRSRRSRRVAPGPDPPQVKAQMGKMKSQQKQQQELLRVAEKEARRAKAPETSIKRPVG